MVSATIPRISLLSSLANTESDIPFATLVVKDDTRIITLIPIQAAYGPALTRRRHSDSIHIETIECHPGGLSLDGVDNIPLLYPGFRTIGQKVLTTNNPASVYGVHNYIEESNSLIDGWTP